MLGGSLSIEVFGDCSLRLLYFFVVKNFIIECGDIDGVVLGFWTNVNDSFFEVDDDSSYVGYWVVVVVWFNVWD